MWQDSSTYSPAKESAIFANTERETNWMYDVNTVNPPRLIDSPLKPRRALSPPRPLVKPVLSAKFPAIPASVLMKSKSESNANTGTDGSELIFDDNTSTWMQRVSPHKQSINFNFDETAVPHNIDHNSLSNTTHTHLHDSSLSGYSRSTSPGFTFSKTNISMNSMFAGKREDKQYRRVRLPDGTSCILVVSSESMLCQLS